MNTPTLALPAQQTSFIGRETEIAEFSTLLADPACRFLTLTGLGGMGKTRLAIAVARQIQSTFPDGIYFVPLQPLQNADQILPTILNVLNLKAIQDPRAELLNFLRDKQLLLVLDNFEHLLDGVDLVPTMLQAAPQVKILTTSRESLKLQEEWERQVRGLDYPEDETSGTDEPYSAMHLFQERARQLRGDVDFDSYSDQIVRICQLVEGMPLALELAAGWVKTLSCQEIAGELQRNPEILAARTHNAPDRHQSMEAVFDQSWRLLTEDEQVVLRGMSVFRGGCTREAAEQVTGASLDILTSLVDKSLLRYDLDRERYDMQELLRQYAETQLMRNIEEEQQVRDSHCSYFTDLLKHREPDFHSWKQRDTVQELNREIDNIRVAWHQAVQMSDFTAIQNGIMAYWDLNDFCGRYQEVAEATTVAISCLEAVEPTVERDYALAVVYNAAGGIGIRLGQFKEARAALHNSIQLFKTQERLPPPGLGTDPTLTLGLLETTVGNYEEAVSYGEASLCYLNQQDDKLNFMVAMYVLANATYSLAQFEYALGCAQQAYQISEKLGDDWFGSYILVVMGNIACALEDYDKAQAHYQSSYRLKEAFDDLGGMAFAVNCLARMAWLQGDFQAAARLYNEGYDLYVKVNDPGGIATAIFGRGDAALGLGDYVDACQYFRQALEMAIDIHWSPLILTIITSICELLLKMGAGEQAVELLVLASHHSADEPLTRTRAEKLLERAKRLLPKAVFDAALARSEAVDLETMARSVLQPLDLSSSSPTPHSQDVANQTLVDPLTPRELEILQLMSAGLTNREIADKLIIGVNTVKKHINHIYSKLGVSDRVKAINQARALDLLPPTTP